MADFSTHYKKALKSIEGKLKDKRLLVVAKECGICYTTLNRLKKGEVRKYEPETITKVQEYLRNH